MTGNAAFSIDSLFVWLRAAFTSNLGLKGLSFIFALGLVAAGAMMLAELPWFALPVLALVPLAAVIPLPQKLPVWGEAILSSFLTGIPAAAACYLVWHSSRGGPG